MASGRARVVLLHERWEVDDGAGEKRRELRGGRGGLALRVPRRDYSGRRFALCRNGRRATVSDQRCGGDGAERAADGVVELDSGGEEMTPDKQRWRGVESVYHAALE